MLECVPAALQAQRAAKVGTLNRTFFIYKLMAMQTRTCNSFKPFWPDSIEQKLELTHDELSLCIFFCGRCQVPFGWSPL